ncbi:MAG: hypothetical protein VST64_01930, partial [Nitrospirota bacterium]|nr:hypothetical protein [Nitrospirota bacterium]
PFILANVFAETVDWGLKRFKSAQKLLVEIGRLECVHRGGRGKNDPPEYVLPKVRATHTKGNRQPAPLGMCPSSDHLRQLAA